MSKASLVTTFAMAAGMLFGGFNNELHAQQQQQNDANKNNITSKFSPADSNKAKQNGSTFVLNSGETQENDEQSNDPWANDPNYKAELKAIEVKHTANMNKIESLRRQNEQKRNTAKANYDSRVASIEASYGSNNRNRLFKIGEVILSDKKGAEKARDVANNGSQVISTKKQMEAAKVAAKANYDNQLTQVDMQNENINRQQATFEVQYENDKLGLHKKYAGIYKQKTTANQKTAADQKKSTTVSDEEFIQKLKDEKYRSYAKAEVAAGREPKDRGEWEQMLKDNAKKHEAKQQQKPGGKP